MAKAEEFLTHASELDHAEENLSALDALSGTEVMAVMRRVFAFARRNPQRVVLFGATARLAGAAILGARAAGSPEPCQVYAVHTVPSRLHRLWRELVSAGLDDDCLLYCGDMLQFFRDVPVVPTMLCAEDFPINPHAIQSSLPAGASVLVLQDNSITTRTNVDGCLAHGLLVPLESLETIRIFQATNRCVGKAAPVATEVFRQTRSVLHQKYFGGNGRAEGSVSVATRELRQASIQDIVSGTSGYGRWPYSCINAVQLPSTLPSGAPWPKISIVTASLTRDVTSSRRFSRS